MVVQVRFLVLIAIAALLVASRSSLAERINQEGRILGPMPAVTNAVLFNTNQADAILSALQIFPVTNPWNEDISNRPLLANSAAMIAQINSDVPSASNRRVRLFQEMNYVIVPTNQPLLTISFLGGYPDESDLNGGSMPNGLYPIATNQLIETWPTGTGTQTVTYWQQNDDGGDRHSIIVQPDSGKVFETWRTLRNGANWYATNGAIFTLNSNTLRPDTWTSGDAAGFPMFPALVRFDECQRGMVEHACRLVVVKSRKQHIYPATHDAGAVSASQTNYPAMGQRLRLKASFQTPTNWTTAEKALVKGLKKYGAMVSDNSSSFFSISITPDDRWGIAFNNIGSAGIAITNFEVIQTTGPTEGPRSAGAPVAVAGPDATATVGVPFQLQGCVSFTLPTTNQWKLYSGPTNLTFANASLTNTTVTFNTNGVYTLMLSGEDGVHAVAYDAVVITVNAAPPVPILLSIIRSGASVNLNWTGGTPPFVIQRTDSFPPAWNGVVTTSLQSATIPMTNAGRFFRVRGS
jgi:hypothetical protein